MLWRKLTAAAVGACLLLTACSAPTGDTSKPHMEASSLPQKASSSTPESSAAAPAAEEQLVSPSPGGFEALPALCEDGEAVLQASLRADGSILYFHRDNAGHFSVRRYHPASDTGVVLTQSAESFQLRPLDDGWATLHTMGEEWPYHAYTYRLYSEDAQLLEEIPLQLPDDWYNQGNWAVTDGAEQLLFPVSDYGKHRIYLADRLDSQRELLLDSEALTGGGGIWYLETRGDWVLFCITFNPLPGQDAAGVLHLPTRQLFLLEFDAVGESIPAVLLDDGRALFTEAEYGATSLEAVLVHLYDPTTEELASHRFAGTVYHTAASDNGRTLVAVGPTDDAGWTIEVLDTQTGARETGTVADERLPTLPILLPLPDASAVYIVGYGGELLRFTPTWEQP